MRGLASPNPSEMAAHSRERRFDTEKTTIITMEIKPREFFPRMCAQKRKPNIGQMSSYATREKCFIVYSK